MKRNRVNVLTVVNSASNITTETIDGKPHNEQSRRQV